MAAATVDVPYLSRFLSIPQPSLTASLEAPTVDLVASVLQAVAIKAREFDELKADKVRQEVELENAVRSGESRTRSLKASVEKGLKEISELRAKLNEQENARATLENELQTIKNSSTTSTSELSTLRSRISSLESSNRDTVALLESKSTAHDRLAEELTTQHQKLIELRREISTLEQTVQTAQSASTTAKFRESNLEQELELLRKRNEWFETELQTKAAELTKTRKEKGARISELQRLNEDTNSTLDAVRRTESALRTRLEDVSQKADSAFAKIQQLQDNAAKQEEENRKELANAQRLAALYDSSLKTTKERLQEVEANQERLQDEAADEIGAARAETETERTEREAAETHVAELEEKIERLEADISALRNNVSAPGTPRRVVNGSSFLGRSGSPISAFSPGASRMKSASTNTELVAENARLKTRLAAAERHSQKLAVQLEDITQTLEEKGPEVQENESEKERLENEVVHLSSTLEHLGKERDKAIKDARKSSAEVNGLRQEGDVLRQQLRDLSAQVKVLLFQIHARDQNLDELSAAEQMQIERMAHGDLDEDDDDSVTPTSRLISERLATFKSIEELQAQNTRLLSLTRNLGEKMESEDARWQQNILAHAQEREELESLRTEVQTLQEDLKSTKTRFDAVARERDMFRRIVQTRGQASLGMSIGSAVSPSQGSSPTPSGVMQSIEHSSQSQETAEMAKMLKEMSQHFETYRNEAGTDLRALRQQSDSLAVEKSKIQSELNRCSTQLTLANERYEMLQANVNMLKTENSELQKRSQILSESASKQDLKSQQVAEELVEAKSMTDSMRSEISNLKAEKDLWKKIEKRLSEDNESLANERNRLNGLLANLQNLQNERERSDSDSRRKLQAQVEALESELQTTKRRLNDEVEDSKKASLRREYDHQQSQKRIDDLVSSLGWTREELAAAKTARDHLQVRNEELLIELKSAEERAQVLQPRPTARSRANEAGSSESARGEDGEEDSITKEQELAVEISELKRDLELARSEIENQKAQIEQYKSISQAAEEELQNFNDAQEEYRLEMDRLIEEKDAKIRSLEERVEDISTELSNTNNELSALRNQELESSRKFEEMKVMLEAEIVRLKDEDERHATAAQFHQEDLKAQAEIAQQAQQNYETELVKHAEATQMLQKVRAEYNSLKVEVVGLRTEAEALRDRLVQKESSWEESKEGYERELNEMRTRREDVNAQNKLLHHQLESVGAQINSLKQRRADFGQEESPSASTGESAADRSVDELREVIRYLRREKEIVDVQYELSIQESKRMRQQLDYSQTQLDETRLKLDQERRSQADQTRSSITQNELIEKINELNVYRESSITLRNEARNAQAQLAEATKKIDELLQQIEPLETKIRVLESDKETTEGEMKLLQEDRNRWQQRTQNILQKYDRVDPAELESLKEQINTLQNERDALIAEKEPLQMQVESIPQQIKSAQDEAIKPWQEQREKFKERAQQALKEQRERLTTERFSLEEELSALKEELEAVKAERDRANASAASHSAQDLPHVSGSTLQNGSEDGQVNESSADGNWAAEKEALEERLRETEIRATSSAETVIKLESQAQNNQKTITRLENQITELQQSLVNVNSQLRQIQSTEQQNPQNDNSAEQLGQLQQDLAEAQKEVESLKANATINAVISNASGEDGSPTISQQAEQIQADLTLQFEERLQQAQDKFQARVDNMKTQLNSKLKSGRQAYKEETDVEHNTAIEQLKAEHLQEIASLKSQHEEEIASMKSQYEQEIASVKSQHQQEIEKLKSEEQTRLAQERAIWQAENAVAPASQATAQKGPYEPTDAEAKDLVANNATIRDIVRKNIVGALSKEKEALVAKVISEQEEIAKVKLEEAEKRAITTKEEAVLMESKRSSVKISMNENRAKLATAKLGIVEKAASETPERPVSEVWTIVRSFKPQAVVATSQQTATKQIPSSSSQKTTQPTNGAKAPTVPAPVQPPTRPVVEDVALARKQANINGPVNPPAAPHTETNSSLPNKPPQGQPANNAGTGPKALQGIVGQSGIPRGGAGQVRGMGRGRGQQGHQGQDPQGQNQYQNQRGGQSGLPRGGGRGQRGRGGTPNVRTDVPQISRESSPNSARGNLNAAARQFVPSGNKRPRDSEGGEDTGSGKRIRGGGAGS